jgi:molecular chaperone GrpE (heat shock protein)
VDIEKAIEFLLENQARSEARFESRFERMQEQFQQAQAQFQKNVEQQGQFNMALGKAMLGLTEHIDSLRAAQAAANEQMKATDERLNALIAVVDGLIKHPPEA